MTVAFMAPALVALMPSNSIVSSSSRRSSTPQVKAPCAPPPWRARLMVRTRLASGRALRVAISTCLFMASSRSMRGPAAVDRQRRPDDQSRGFAPEEDLQLADLLDGGEALMRLLGEEHVADHLFARDPMRLRLVFDLRLDEGRPDVARADRIAGDVLLGRLERRHLGEADDAVLRRHVGGLEGRGDEPMRRGDVDDAPHPVLRIAGTARRVVWKAEDRSMAMTWSHLSIGNWSIGATCWMPALLTRMSSRPKVSSVRSTMRPIEPGFVM